LCLCVVVVLVGVVLVAGFADELVEELLPQPATTTVLARTAKIVSMAVSGVLLMGRAPVVARGLKNPPYQGPAAAIAVG
jgi:hypothetical protein